MSNNIYEEENNILFNNFLNDYFYKEFKKGNSILELELIISPVCNLGCKYCYLNKYYSKSFPKSTFDELKTIENLKKILKWIDKNNFKVNLDIFSGELFAQNIGYKVMDIIYDWALTTKNKPLSIVIPTNFTFILSEEYTKKVEDILYKFKNIDIPVKLSASFDGKYCEENRPYVRDLDIKFDHNRNDIYYEKVFNFAKKYDTGFHPMIYSKKIEKWKDNFLWFQEQFKKYDIDWKNLYLLQVRNVEWNEKELKDFYDFIYFLCEYSWNKFDGNSDDFIDFIFRGKAFNILLQPFAKSKKGLPCAIQSELTIKVSDLKVFPCHRLLYPDLEIGEYIEDDENILEFKTKNASLGLTIYGMHTNNQPMCNKCDINNICIGGCLGSQYEVNGSLFIPIQSVCKLNFNLILAIIKFCKDKKILNKLYANLSGKTLYQIKKVEELIND